MRTSMLAVSLVVLACASQEPRSKVTADQTRDAMIGAWDVKLSLTHPYPIGLAAPAARQICGTMGFVDNEHVSQSDYESTPSLGVYDLDLGRLGLNWLNDAAFPAAVVTRTASVPANTVAAGSDSVRIVLNPGSREQIVLEGRHNVNGMDGVWVAQSARGTASGLFTLRPHDDTRWSC
jgi:hypothetical protein